MASYKGIDVSKWQGEINWNKVKKDGINFAMIRAGFGKESSQVDSYFHKNIKAAQSVGIKCGVYWYSYATTAADAKKEAQVCLSSIRGYRLEYPIAFDIEDKCQQSLTARERTDICKAFCEEIEAAGYYVMIYCNKNWWTSYFIKDELKQYDLWLAQWNIEVPSVSCGIWQHTDKGKVNGINGNVDLNISYRDYENIMRLKGLNGFKGKEITYVIQKGDNLTAIAKAYNTTVDSLVKLNNISNRDKIYAGQTLKIQRG